jgi:hypothetical protein
MPFIIARFGMAPRRRTAEIEGDAHAVTASQRRARADRLNTRQIWQMTTDLAGTLAKHEDQPVLAIRGLRPPLECRDSVAFSDYMVPAHHARCRRHAQSTTFSLDAP